ncbi:di-heme oxidoreductase family protein [Pseudovibrio japonicus]|uniref:di-heme oxidoreductase family protein n=1 Tax=Pseudovibrio japonicus TaxID=366534 RepID=UPI0016765396|nr:di-heme oxidoredictase family protein [Pseudovibrio japonicus]
MPAMVPATLRSRAGVIATTAAAFSSLFIPAATAIDLERRTDLSSEDKARVNQILKAPTDFSKAEKFELMQAGKTTSRKPLNRAAFTHPSTNLPFEQHQDFRLGESLFQKLWVSTPSSTRASDGLGPLFNARSCESCHPKAGRGRPPVEDERPVSIFLRLSVAPSTPEERALIESGKVPFLPEPTYGSQLQNFGVPGVPGEGEIKITYEEIKVDLSEGEVAYLRKPTYTIENLAYGPMSDHALVSARVAPPMIGLGLLEAIAETDITSQADPEDADQDGISGRVSWVDPNDSDTRTVGRFGWKALKASVQSQSAGAFTGDLGLSTPYDLRNYGDCTEAQTVCFEQAHGEQADLGISEAPDPVLDLVVFYSQNLAVPARRDVNDPRVLAGKKVFHEAGCASCHTPKYVTSRTAENPVHQFQLIWPYTDLLLHDLGQGLSDDRPTGSASGNEWKTPPLWGIGLTENINNHRFFLHDGRARGLLEAVLWHGGEAEAAKTRVVEMPAKDRANLIRFLETL